MLKKRILAYVAAAVLMLSLSQTGDLTTPVASAAVVPGSYNLKLMSFNVRTMHADDGTPNSWDNRKDIAVRTIDAFAPDVIGMQEAWKAQLDYFIDNCNAPYQSIGTSRTGSLTSGEFSNVMYRSDKFNLLDWGQFWISETPDVPGSKSSLDSAYPRMSTWVKLQAKSNANAVFYYFNTHLSLVDAAAVQGANLILSKVAELVGSSDIPVFIGGDLNSTETSTAYAIFHNSSFDDTWSGAGRSFSSDGTFHGFTGDVDRSHIDWIFARNITAINSIEINRYNENGYYPSDHFPIELNVTIPLTTDTSSRPIGQTIWLKSAANDKYVSARANSANNPLWASATSANTWEKYEIVDAGNGLVALKAKANNLYLSARINTEDVPLRAAASSIGSWERFIWCRNGDGTVSFHSIANNKYVSARINKTNSPLETRIDSIASWEKFTWGV